MVIYVNELQFAAFKVNDKTAGRDHITPLGENIRQIWKKILDEELLAKNIELVYDYKLLIDSLLYAILILYLNTN
ncbi:MAG: hypothetical protein WKF66_16130 [Pedobacter sp.]